MSPTHNRKARQTFIADASERLIREMRRSGSLAEAKEMILSEVRALDKSQTQLYEFQNAISRATAREEIVQALDGLLDSTIDRANAPTRGPLHQIALVTSKQGSKGYYDTLGLGQVLYLFSAAALSKTAALIHAEWLTKAIEPLYGVCTQTAQGIPRVTSYRSLAALRPRLPSNFITIHRSIIVNADAITHLSLANNLKQVGVTVAAKKSVDWLAISRAHVNAVRDIFGLGL